MKSSWTKFGLIVAAVLTISISLLLNFPANWLARIMVEQSKGRVMLADARGTFWQGSAVLAFGNGEEINDAVGVIDTRMALPGRLEWQWQFPALRPTLRLKHAGVLDQAVTMHWSLNRLLIDAGTMHLPLSLAMLVGAPMNTIRPSGMAQLQWNAMELPLNQPAMPVSISGRLQLMQVAAAMNPAIAAAGPLGDYRIDWRWKAGQLDAQLITERGPLLIQGQGVLQNGHFNFSGRASIDSAVSTATLQGLQPLLNVIGRRVKGATSGGDEVVIQIGS